MKIADEYRLSEYQDLGILDENEKVHIVRNRLNGLICVRKILSAEQAEIYEFISKHPTIYVPRIYEIIQNKERLVVIEEYFDGKNLEEILSERAFSEREAAEIVLKLCDCLKPFHEAKPAIVCRDLKPQNIIMTNAGELKLIDFDIARVYCPGKKRDTVMMGTEGYAAPEQFGFGQTDARTDIYGLGVLMNYLLIRCLPTEWRATGRFAGIIDKCTQLNPKERYQSVEELKQAIRDVTGEKKSNVVYEMSQQKKKWKNIASRYRIPGFRSGKLWKKIVAVAGYFLVTLFCFSVSFRDAQGVPI